MLIGGGPVNAAVRHTGMDDELDQYRQFLRGEERLAVTILKGQLVLESLLTDILESLGDRSGSLAEAANTFHRKWLIAKSFAGANAADPAWQLVRAINRLRNHIAHDLRAESTEAQVAEIAAALKLRDPVAFGLIPEPTDKCQVVSHTVSFLIGFLQAYRRERGA